MSMVILKRTHGRRRVGDMAFSSSQRSWAWLDSPSCQVWVSRPPHVTSARPLGGSAPAPTTHPASNRNNSLDGKKRCQPKIPGVILVTTYHSLRCPGQQKGWGFRYDSPSPSLRLECREGRRKTMMWDNDCSYASSGCLQYEFLMSSIWIFGVFGMDFSCLQCGPFMSSVWTFHVFDMNFLCLQYEICMSSVWTFHVFVMNFLCLQFELFVSSVWTFRVFSVN